MQTHKLLQRKLNKDAAAVCSLLSTFNGGALPVSLQDAPQKPEVLCAVLRAFVDATKHLPKGWMVPDLAPDNA